MHKYKIVSVPVWSTRCLTYVKLTCAGLVNIYYFLIRMLSWPQLLSCPTSFDSYCSQSGGLVDDRQVFIRLVIYWSSHSERWKYNWIAKRIRKLQLINSWRTQPVINNRWKWNKVTGVGRWKARGPRRSKCGVCLMFKCCKFLDKGALGGLGPHGLIRVVLSNIWFSVHLEPKNCVNVIIMNHHLLSIVLQFVLQNVQWTFIDSVVMTKLWLVFFATIYKFDESVLYLD